MTNSHTYVLQNSKKENLLLLTNYTIAKQVLTTTFMQCAQETTKFGKITHNKGHFAVQGHSKFTDFGTNRKLIYDFLLVINTNLPLLSCTVSRIWIYGLLKLQNGYIWQPLLRLSPPPRRRGSSGRSP